MATDNHEFRQPPYGQERWDNDWYENFDLLDERVEIRGPETSREDYVPHENALFRATDTDNLFLGDGEQWVQIQSSGDNPSFGTVGADRVRVSEPPEQDTDVIRHIDLESLDTGGGSFDHRLSETLDAQENDISNVGSLQTGGVSVIGLGGYSDTFDTDTSSGWTTISGSVEWDTENGFLEVGDSARATINQPNTGSGLYTITLTSEESSSGNLGLIWAVQNDNTFYHVRIHPGNDAVQLFLFEEGSPTNLGNYSASIDTGTAYTLSVRWDEDTGGIEIYLDSDPRFSSPIITAQDTTLGPGTFGIRAYDGEGYLDSISFEPASSETIITNEFVSTSDLQADQGAVSGVFSVAGGVVSEQRGAPTTDELEAGERIQYTSDGSDGHSAGDLVSARNDSGTIVDQVISAAADDT